jgi:hypothetical protein
MFYHDPCIPTIPVLPSSAPWRPHFLTLPLAKAGGGVLLLYTRCYPESLELFPPKSLCENVGRHVVGRAVRKRDDLCLEELASVFLRGVDVSGPFGMSAVLGGLDRALVIDIDGDCAG